MKLSSRKRISFTVVKGAMIEETTWSLLVDFARSKRENLGRLRAENFIGRAAAWLSYVAKVLNRRFGPEGAIIRWSFS